MIRNVKDDPITAEEKRLWLEALRSGKYKQTKGTLGRKNLDGSASYCCLGVACEVFGPGLGDERADRRLPVAGEKRESTCKWPSFNSYTRQGLVLERVMLANDEGTSFSEIANILEVMLIPAEEL